MVQFFIERTILGGRTQYWFKILPVGADGPPARQYLLSGDELFDLWSEASIVMSR